MCFNVALIRNTEISLRLINNAIKVGHINSHRNFLACDDYFILSDTTRECDNTIYDFIHQVL